MTFFNDITLYPETVRAAFKEIDENKHISPNNPEILYLSEPDLDYQGVKLCDVAKGLMCGGTNVPAEILAHPFYPILKIYIDSFPITIELRANYLVAVMTISLRMVLLTLLGGLGPNSISTCVSIAFTYITNRASPCVKSICERLILTINTGMSEVQFNKFISDFSVINQIVQKASAEHGKDGKAIYISAEVSTTAGGEARADISFNEA